MIAHAMRKKNKCSLLHGTCQNQVEWWGHVQLSHCSLNSVGQVCSPALQNLMRHLVSLLGTGHHRGSQPSYTSPPWLSIHPSATHHMFVSFLHLGKTRTTHSLMRFPVRLKACRLAMREDEAICKWAELQVCISCRVWGLHHEEAQEHLHCLL